MTCARSPAASVLSSEREDDLHAGRIAERGEELLHATLIARRQHLRRRLLNGLWIDRSLRNSVLHVRLLPPLSSGATMQAPYPTNW